MGVPYAEVIGDPVAHSKSPLIHNFWLRRLGLQGEYRRARLPSEKLGAYFQGRRADPNWRGCNVTIPHKQAVLAHLDVVAPEASAAGAANTVVRAGDRLFGFNTDLTALRADLLPFAQEAVLFEFRVVLFGAGGAARAVLQAMSEERDVVVALYNRDVSKAAALLVELGVNGEAGPLGARLPPTNLIVNATSLGMDGFPPLPVDLTDVSSAVVYDLVYAPLETDLLRRARAKGLATLDGLHLLLGQARLAFEHFFSFPPPPGTDCELRELMAS